MCLWNLTPDKTLFPGRQDSRKDIEYYNSTHPEEETIYDYFLQSRRFNGGGGGNQDQNSKILFLLGLKILLFQ